MRMLPKVTGRSLSKRSIELDVKDHRRSWHVGRSWHSHHSSNHHDSACPTPTTTTSSGPINSHSKKKRSKSSQRLSGGHRRKTWHFPRISRHSNHVFDESEILSHDKHREKFETETSERKTFSYAPHAQPHRSGVGASSTRVPDPPDSADVAANTNSNSADNDSTRNKRGHKDPWFKKVKKGTSQFFKSIEVFLFPDFHTGYGTQHRFHLRSTLPHVRGGVLLRYCSTPTQHKAKILETVELAKHLYGERGLRAVGFEFRMKACPKHSPQMTTSAMKMDSDEEEEEEEEDDDDESTTLNKHQNGNDPSGNDNIHGGLMTILEKQGSIAESAESDVITSSLRSEDIAGLVTKNETNPTTSDEPADLESQGIGNCNGENQEADCPQHICHLCSSRLFHIESNTLVDADNRNEFIADGDMYNAIARLCQENAHEIMQRKYNLKWVTVCTPDEDDPTTNPLKRTHSEPVRALVNAEHPLLAQENPGKIATDRLQYYATRPTLLIATGRGKVRAGIFSRQHIIVSGMESSTALPLIHEARLRELNLVIIDPNVHGESLGMVTFEKSMTIVFRVLEEDKGHAPPCETEDYESGRDHQNMPFSNRDLYILSHSASGSHLARYLLDKSDRYLPHIRAIAFTDSTHNVQWARQKGKHELVSLLESPACVYFRCDDPNKDANWRSHRAGEETPHDSFWKHRFGNVRTLWAGTKEHSLTNWFAHAYIWEHFDSFLMKDKTKDDTGTEKIHDCTDETTKAR